MRYFKAYAPILSVFFLALFVRIVYNITVAHGYTPTFDAGVYNNLAKALVETGCYCRAPHQPSTFRPPLWPFIIAAIYFFLGEHSAYVRLFYCVLDSGTCVFVYLIAKDLFGKRIALITGIAAALYVGLFIWTGWLYSETLYTFFLTALLFSLSRLQQMMLLAKIYKDEYKNVSKAELLYVVASGLLLGLTLLIRPNGIILIGLLFLWVALIGKVISWKTKLKNILIILLISTIINVPWLYRNYQVTHTLIPISTIGTTLIGNYNDTVFQGDHVIRGMWLPPANTVNPDFHNYTPADEQKDTSRVINWMRTHINEVPILLGLHLLNMWTPYLYAHGLPFEQFPNRLTSKFMLYFIPTISIPVFLLAFVGLLVTWSYRRKQLLLIYLMITLTILQNIAFYGSPRYRAPIEPLLIILAGGAFWCFMRYRLRNSSDGQGDDTTPQGN